jgi:hypothetical protein
MWYIIINKEGVSFLALQVENSYGPGNGAFQVEVGLAT